MPPTKWEWFLFALVVIFLIYAHSLGNSWKDLRFAAGELFMAIVLIGVFIGAVALLHFLVS